MSFRTPLCILALTVPSVARAQEPPTEPTPEPPPPLPVPAPTPAAVVVPVPAAPAEIFEGPGEHSFSMQARLATQVGTTAALAPGFAMGVRSGNLVLGGQVGVMLGKLDVDGDSFSASIVQLVPMVTYDWWTSKDGRARMNLVAGIGIGKASLDADGDKLTATFVPVVAGIGGDYYLSKNFALGVEFGFQTPLVTSVQSDGDDLNISASVESVHGLFRFTFIKD